MNSVTTRKRLFADTFRRRPWTGAPRPRLLGGQAMAQAQRLSRTTVKPFVLGLSQFLIDLTILAATGQLTFSFLPVHAFPPFIESAAVWFGALLVVVVNRALGAYGMRRMRVLWLSVVLAVVGQVVGLGGLWGLLQSAGLARLTFEPWILSWGLLSIGLLIVGRVMFFMWMGRMMRSGQLEHRIAIVGGGADIAPLIREIDTMRGRGRRMCGFFDERMDVRSPSVVGGYHKMGDVDDLVEFARLAKLDTVIIAIPRASQERIRELLARLFVLPVDIRVLDGSDVPEYSRKRRSRIGKIRLVEIYKRPLGGWKSFQKRVFDLVFASLAIVMLAPVMAVVAVLIKLDSPGPVLFKQKRHGYNNKPIEVLKFRSMYSDQCDPTAVRQVRRGDARVTRIGRFIRRASIDELPQFFNVLKGDLSLVGPRPHATSARTGDILYEQISQAYSARHKVKPGVTGWAQIKGWRGEMNSNAKIEARVEHDLYYIEHWSLWLDFKIMVLTPWSLVTTKNAY